MKDFFTSNGRNSANKFLEGLNKWFFCQKKVSIYLVGTNTIEKNNKKKAKQQWMWNKNSFTKSDEQMKKGALFFQKTKKKGY